MDAIKNGEIHLLVNTPSGRESTEDSSDVRKAAIKYKIPYITTTAAAIAAAKGIAARREGSAQGALRCRSTTATSVEWQILFSGERYLPILR